MGKKISAAAQQKAAEELAKAMSSFDGVSAEIDSRSSGTQVRHTVSATSTPESWRQLAEALATDHAVDYCSMITGIHWPDNADATWQVIAHLMRTGVYNPKVVDKRVHETKVDIADLSIKNTPIEFEVTMSLPETRTPSVPSVADIWVGAEWNEKETWDLVGIDFEGHEGMRRVLLPHDTPTGYHPLQKQHKLRYHDFNEMYDDAQGFGRKPEDSGRVK